MRALIVAVAVCAMASTALGAPPAYVIDPLFAAPIDRALENVSRRDDIPEARRVSTLARLNLLAWARNDADFYYRRSDQSLSGWTGDPCPLGPPYQTPPRAPIEPGDLCSSHAYNLEWGGDGPMPRDMPSAPSEAALARLEAARTLYARAVELTPDDLWMRLGYAYVLEQQNKLEEARAQLREIIRIGTRELAEEDWHYYVLREATDQLGHLANTRRDRRALRRLQASITRAQERMESRPQPMSPIVVPLADVDFESLIDRASPVGWNFSGQQTAPPRGWLRANAAWLVWDPNRRASINSGFDMIGERAWGVFWTDGFEALRALDDNRDGELTGGELGGLALWRDANGDGVSQADEVRPLGEHGVVALATAAETSRPGLMTAPAGVRFEDGRSRPLYDWTPGLDRAPVS